MKVQIINKSHHPLPAYATTQSAGMDIRANLSEPVEIKPLERKLIPTGLYIALPDGYEAQMRPRPLPAGAVSGKPPLRLPPRAPARQI